MDLYRDPNYPGYAWSDTQGWFWQPAASAAPPPPLGDHRREIDRHVISVPRSRKRGHEVDGDRSRVRFQESSEESEDSSQEDDDRYLFCLQFFPIHVCIGVNMLMSRLTRACTPLGVVWT